MMTKVLMLGLLYEAPESPMITEAPLASAAASVVAPLTAKLMKLFASVVWKLIIESEIRACVPVTRVTDGFVPPLVRVAVYGADVVVPYVFVVAPISVTQTHTDPS